MEKKVKALKKLMTAMLLALSAIFLIKAQPVEAATPYYADKVDYVGDYVKYKIGKETYYVKSSYTSSSTSVYIEKNKKKVKLFTRSVDAISLSARYGSWLYYVENPGTQSQICRYNLTTKKKYLVRKDASHMMIYNDKLYTYGKGYALGYNQAFNLYVGSTDGKKATCITKNMGKFNLKIYNGKLYYVYGVNSDSGKQCIVRCDLNGAHKKTMLTVPRGALLYKFTDKYIEYENSKAQPYRMDFSTKKAKRISELTQPWDRLSW